MTPEIRRIIETAKDEEVISDRVSDVLVQIHAELGYPLKGEIMTADSARKLLELYDGRSN